MKVGGINGKSILVTGGTGSFGRAFVRTLLSKYKPKNVRIYSRDELKQWHMAREFSDNPRLRFFIGDVRDPERIKRATEGVDIVIHTAALKHVPACEYNPMDAVRTNVDGAINVINACLDNNVTKVIALSTDKAVNPVNIYGATKLTMERLFIQSNSYRGSHRKTRFSVVRYGNVLGSSGSVIPLFREQSKSGRVTITDEQMTRFWITLPQAVDFVLSCLEHMQGGEIFVPRIPSMKVVDLARVVAPKARHSIIGMRAGERLHEYLITEQESTLTWEFSDRYVILSDSRVWIHDPKPFKKAKKVKRGFSYNSLDNTEYLSDKEVGRYLKSE